MSSFKKNTLAAALVLGMSVAGSAAAYTYWTAGNTAPEKVANFAFDGTTTQVYTMQQTVQVRVDTTDFIIGRSTGFAVRVDLPNALFNGLPGSGDALDDPSYIGAQLPAGWTVRIAAGGTAGTNFVVFNVIPPDGGTTGIVPGEIIKIDMLALRSVEELAASGGQIPADFRFVDPVTAQVLEPGKSDKRIILLESGNPLTRTCTPLNGDTAKKIDVADTSASGGSAPKTSFSQNGEIGGSASSGTENDEFDFGDYSVGVDPAFSFGYLATDTFVSTMQGPNSFSPAFTSIYLSTNNCATSAVAGVIGTGANSNKVTFSYSLAQVGGTASGFTVSVCGVVNKTAVILDNNPITFSTVATRGTNNLPLAGCELLPLTYNGSIVKVYNFNEAGTTTAQSFLRVINPSNSAGLVTIVAWDDDGNFRGPVKFTLNAKNSRQLNSNDFENGNPAKATGSFGDGVGKWRFEVTGEFPGMRVSSLNRNLTDGTVTNLTDADGHGEQRFDELFDNQ
ncbi:MAG: hypothetical protein V4704_00830 [Pseudomonadota bacterium]